MPDDIGVICGLSSSFAFERFPFKGKLGALPSASQASAPNLTPQLTVPAEHWLLGDVTCSALHSTSDGSAHKRSLRLEGYDFGIGLQAAES